MKKEFSAFKRRTLWRWQVLKRDKYHCKICNSTRPLEAHHILSLRLFPSFEFDLNNGVALCENCHRKIWLKELDYVDLFNPELSKQADIFRSLTQEQLDKLVRRLFHRTMENLKLFREKSKKLNTKRIR